MNASTLLLPLLLLPVTADPAKDVIPEGVRRIKFVLSVDASAIGACLCRPCEIREGDTYAEIARRECGDARCAEEIRLLNPGVNPDKLRPGDYLRIPPRAAAAESRPESRTGGGACWVLVTVQWGRGGQGSGSAIIEGEPIDVWTRDGLRVPAVPRDKLRWFLELDWKKLDVKQPLEGTTRSEVIVPTWLLPNENPTMTVEKRVTLKSSKDGPVFEVEERRIDRRGNLITGKAQPRSGSFESWPVAIIGVGALLAVIAMGLRRRAAGEVIAR